MRHRFSLASCLTVALACFPVAHADEFDWLATFGVSQTASEAFSHYPEVAVDAAGNTYVVGEFKGTVDFDPGPGVFEVTSRQGKKR